MTDTSPLVGRSPHPEPLAYPPERNAGISESLGNSEGTSGRGDLSQFAGRIDWLCDRCRQPVADGDGLIAADTHAALARMLDSGDEYVPRVPWQVLHHGCDDQGQIERHSSEIEGWRTPADVVERLAYLTAKGWFAHTDLAALLRRAAR